MNTETIIKNILTETLSLGEHHPALNAASPLLGAMPELDSMSIVAVLTGIEEHFDMTIPDDEIAATHFETLGTLTSWIEHLRRDL